MLNIPGIEEYIIKVRNERIFIRTAISTDLEMNAPLDIEEYLNYEIKRNGLSPDNTIKYKVEPDGFITCLGIDDGYRHSYNSAVKRIKERQNIQ